MMMGRGVWRRVLVVLAVGSCVVLGACGGCDEALDGAVDDVGILDVGEDDLDVGDGGGTGDTGDSGDAGDSGDTGGDDLDAGDVGDSVDAEVPGDVGEPGDVAEPGSDVGEPGEDAGEPTGPGWLTEPCQNGDGWTLFRFHYNNFSTSARIDVWDAACDYSLAPDSACNVRTVTQGFGDVSRTPNGYPIVTLSDYLRVRFSVEGLQFTDATIHLEAHGNFSVASTEYRVWSPLYGERFGGPINNVLSWDTLDWTGNLMPGDSPGLTAIQIYARQSSHPVAIRSVELCVE